MLLLCYIIDDQYIVSPRFFGDFGVIHGDRSEGKCARKNIWLVVLTPLKNRSQLRLLFPIYGKINLFHTTNQYINRNAMKFYKTYKKEPQT